jgi:hypothetical protein
VKRVVPELTTRAVGTVVSQIQRGDYPGGRHRPGGEAWTVWFARSLAGTGTSEAWPFMEALLTAHGPNVACMQAAGELGDPRAVAFLDRWIGLAGPRGDATVEAIARIPGREAVEHLLGVYQRTLVRVGSLSPAPRGLVAEALRARASEALTLLREACAAERATSLTVRAFAALFPEEAVPHFCRLAFEAPAHVRPFIFEGLATIGTQEAVETLLRAMEEPALRPLARRSLIRVAKRDLGARPDTWKRWFKNAAAKGRRQTMRDPGTVPRAVAGTVRQGREDEV